MKRRTITSEYHFSVTQIKRSAGQSAIAAAAYRAGEKLHSDYYGQDSDYTRKSGVVDDSPFCCLGFISFLTNQRGNDII